MYHREIKWDREARDYAGYLDGELVCFSRTYQEAEITLDQLVFELMTDGMHYTATQMDASTEPEPTDDIDPLPEQPGDQYPGVDYEEERAAA